MKTQLEKNMEEIFDIDPNTKPIIEVIDESKVTPVDNKPALNTTNDIDSDYMYARENLRNIIDSAQNSIEDLASIASTSESPRAYEVLSTLMKTMVDANKDLLEIQKKVKDLKQETQQQPQNVTNALFVGSTSELTKLIKNNS